MTLMLLGAAVQNMYRELVKPTVPLRSVEPSYRYAQAQSLCLTLTDFPRALTRRLPWLLYSCRPADSAASRGLPSLVALPKPRACVLTHGLLCRPVPCAGTCGAALTTWTRSASARRR
jgi:hypothetical protein